MTCGKLAVVRFKRMSGSLYPSQRARPAVDPSLSDRYRSWTRRPGREPFRFRNVKTNCIQRINQCVYVVTIYAIKPMRRYTLPCSKSAFRAPLTTGAMGGVNVRFDRPSQSNTWNHLTHAFRKPSRKKKTVRFR